MTTHEQIEKLEQEALAAENWEAKFELLDRAWQLKVESGIVKRISDDYQCEGCSA